MELRKVDKNSFNWDFQKNNLFFISDFEKNK